LTIAANLLGISAIPATAIEPEAVPAAATTSVDTKQSAENWQRIATESLTNAKSQGSAADALADAEWSLEGGEIRVQTELSKTMLPMVVNPEADKIVRMALRNAGAGALKLVLLPGIANTTAIKKPRAARTGSAQAKAMEHPVVQQAQRLFNAEIRNVIDLRDTD
jgi:DNA polymerase-3 subunit gamma/tau